MRFITCSVSTYAVPLILAMGCLFASNQLTAEEKPQAAANEKNSKAESTDLKALNSSGTVLIDLKQKRLVLKAEVVLQEGLLEMLCCLKQTKEHESILAVDAKAYVIHAGLLALGAKPGKAVSFDPKFQPPTGQTIQIFLQWQDKKKKWHRVPAQDWIQSATSRFYSTEMDVLPSGVIIPEDNRLFFDKKLKQLTWFGHMPAKEKERYLDMSIDKNYQKAIKKFYKQSQPKPMKASWVFPGSQFHVDEKTKEKYYLAEGGDLICVANFPSATIDIGVESSASGETSLVYEAKTAAIPEIGTKVSIELVPVFGPKKKSK
jgi:hypothetical protein